MSTIHVKDEKKKKRCGITNQPGTFHVKTPKATHLATGQAKPNAVRSEFIAKILTQLFSFNFIL